MVSKPNGHLCGYVTYQQKEKSSKKTKQVKRGKIKNKKPYLYLAWFVSLTKLK